MDIPSPINFHNKDEVVEWVRNTVEKRPYRSDFFNAFVQEIQTFTSKKLNIVELGSGPGHLAEAILDNCQVKRYNLLDFSVPMHNLAKEKLVQYKDNTLFIERDFKTDNWTTGLGSIDMVVSMQAIHEVRHKNHVPALFRQIYDLLPPGGLFLYSDHYFSENSTGKNPALYFTQSGQPQTLKESGFADIRLLLDKGEMALYATLK